MITRTPDTANVRRKQVSHRRAQQRAARAAWAKVCEQLESPGIELTVSNFAVMYVHYQQCREAGIQFDRGFVAVMRMLKQQVLGTDADTDDDTSVDDGFEHETCEDDWGTKHGLQGPPPPRPCEGTIDSLYTGEWRPFSIVTSGQDARVLRGPYDDRKAVSA